MSYMEYERPSRGTALTHLATRYGLRRKWWGLETDESLRRRTREAIARLVGDAQRVRRHEPHEVVGHHDISY